MMMGKKTTFALFLLLGLSCVMFASSAAAGTFEVTPTMRTSIDKTLGKADANVKGQLLKQLDDFTELRKTGLRLDDQLKSAKYRNEEELGTLRKQINVLGADKAKKLEEQVKVTESRYDPLFKLYKYATAKVAKEMKLPVQLARDDIKAKKSALKFTKSAVAGEKKSLRTTLGGIDPLQVRMKAARSDVRSLQSRMTSEWKTFSTAARGGPVRTISESLGVLISLIRQSNEVKQSISRMEGDISNILSKTKQQLASSSWK